MSYTRVLIAVAFAAVLAFAALVLLRGGGGEDAAGGGGAGFFFDPARAVELIVTYPGDSGADRTERLVRDAGAASWNVYWTDAGGAEAVWPAAAAQIRGGLRILSTLEATPADRGSRVESRAAEVRVLMEDGSERRMVLSGRALAGRVLAEVGGAGELQPVWLDRSIMEMLVGPPGAAGPRAWRDQSAIPGSGADVSRAVLEGGGTAGTLAISRVQGRWALRQPVSEVAEPEAISKLFTSLANVRVVDFLDGGVPDRTGLPPDAEPVAVLTLESDQRDASSPGAPVAVVRRTLAVGHTADLAGRNVFARVRQEMLSGDSHEVAFERVVIVSGEALASIVMDPAAYISRRTFTTPAADVGSVVLRMKHEEQRYERTLDGWRISGDEGRPPLAKDEAEGLNAMLHVVMQAPASRVMLADFPGEPAAVLELTTLGGTPIGEASLVLSGDGQSLGVYTRGVIRLHDAQASQAVVGWLGRR